MVGKKLVLEAASDTPGALGYSLISSKVLVSWNKAMQVVSAKDAPVPTDKNFLCQKVMHLALDA